MHNNLMSDFLNAAVAKQRQETLSKSPQLTIGEMLLLLEPMLSKERSAAECNVVFDFEYLFPSGFDSWRGSYAEIAISFSDWDKGKKPFVLADFYEQLKATIGKEFEGYKGGEFVMNKNTPVWVANYGNAGNTGVVGIKDDGYQIIILTAYCEF